LSHDEIRTRSGVSLVDGRIREGLGDLGRDEDPQTLGLSDLISLDPFFAELQTYPAGEIGLARGIGLA
jgi:hypothetical protein